MKFDYDIIVIWSGSWGLTVSIWLASAWKKVALIEKGLIGWDCTNYWCVPSKAFIDVAKNSEEKDLKTILDEVRSRRKQIQDEETKQEIEKHWIKVYIWTASFKDKNTIKIDWKDNLEISWKYMQNFSSYFNHWCKIE